MLPSQVMDIWYRAILVLESLPPLSDRLVCTFSVIVGKFSSWWCYSMGYWRLQIVRVNADFCVVSNNRAVLGSRFNAILASFHHSSCCRSGDVIVVYEDKEKLYIVNKKFPILHQQIEWQNQGKKWKRLFVDSSQNPSRSTSFKVVSVCDSVGSLVPLSLISWTD